MRIRLFSSLFIILLLLAAGCANIGNPSGGPRDEDPPIMVASYPPPGSTNVTREKIQIVFNEIVNVKDAFSTVVVSPPSKAVPRVTALGRRVTVDFDSLQPNTTYTIDFADAISDNNEGNVLEGFSYTFSTGPDIDTLRISGRVLGARDLEPQQGMLVGVHRADEDSAFTTKRFLRVAKTDDRGRFTIRGLAPGNYHVYALDDRDNDGAYANPEENLGFYPFVVSPSTEAAVAMDTVFNVLTGEVDTVVSRSRTRYLPNDILIRAFNSGKRNQYLYSNERPDSSRVFLKFNAPASELPDVRVVGREWSGPIGVAESRETMDSITYWLAPELARIDSLTLSVGYLRTDSTGQLAAAVDTLKFFNRHLPAKKNAKKPDKKDLAQAAKDSLAALTFAFTLPSGGPKVTAPAIIEFPRPLSRLDTAAIHLLQSRDSTWIEVGRRPDIFRTDSLSPRSLSIAYPWEFGAGYRLQIDSLAATDIYGKTSLPFSSDFKMKQAEDFCSLSFNISGVPAGMEAFVELLSSNDAVTETVPVRDGHAQFDYLEPGKFYARLILDANGDGLYDTGDYAAGRQPEVAYYYPKAINIKKNWSREEDWNIFSTAIDMQKPSALLRNKPKTTKGRPAATTEEPEEEEIFDPTRNPFDPNRR